MIYGLSDPAKQKETEKFRIPQLSELTPCNFYG